MTTPIDLEQEERLREMGFAPRWRLRARPAVAVGGTQAEADAVAPIATPIAPIAATDKSVAEQGVSVAESIAPAAASITPTDAPVPTSARDAAIAALEWRDLAGHIAQCDACALARTRRKTVPGVGSATAGWMFVGEAPGAEEDAQGEPFVGQAGRLLDNMLRAIGLHRARDVYIANVLKCRPPNNRNPEPGEVARCSPYLERQLELIRPRIIVALGRFAAMTLLDTESSIAALRGRLHRYRGVPLVVTYHPAYLLRNLPDKAKAWEDLTFAKKAFLRLQSEAASPS
jgi:DNA polymerase